MLVSSFDVIVVDDCLDPGAHSWHLRCVIRCATIGPFVQRNKRVLRARWNVLFTCAHLIACGSESAPEAQVSEFEVTTADWAPAAPELPYDEGEPIDPRVIRMDPESHRGQERLCDVTFLSDRQPDRQRGGRGVRRLIRCKGASGVGWAELAFSEEARAFVDFVRPGVRIRVRVSESPGHANHPRFEFIASVENVDVHESEEAPVQAGDDWSTIVAQGDFGRHACGVAFVGWIRPVHDAPNELTHVADVVCASRGFETWVRMYFPEATRTSALRVVRGEVVPARLMDPEVTRELPPTSLPMVLYEGP